jgi:membrane fusion protein (multidrug efflux system)
MNTPKQVKGMRKILRDMPPIRRRMIIMLLSVLILMGLIVAFNIFKSVMIKKYMSGASAPPQTVSTIKVVEDDWQPQLSAVGNVRAFRGVELSTEVSGIVRAVPVTSGMDVRAGDVLVELTQAADIALLDALKAQADLAKIINDRDRMQLEIRAISQNVFDASSADLKAKQAQVRQQTSLVSKKNLKAPFSGRVGIVTINPGQYVNPGDKLFTIQTIDPIFIDFTLPQNTVGKADAFGERVFKGKVSAISPKVELNTRNIQVEAIVGNSDKKLLPGMFANVVLELGSAVKYMTIPQTAVTYNPYGSIVFVVNQTDRLDKDGKPIIEAEQTFVTTGATRGDQVAILQGLKLGSEIVTSGQLKLKNGTPLIINNTVLPANNANPKPLEK